MIWNSADLADLADIKTSIAVLPFLGPPVSSDAPLPGEGIAKGVIVRLSRDRALRVASRQASFQPAIMRATPDEIGARLGVRLPLSGTNARSHHHSQPPAKPARCKPPAIYRQFRINCHNNPVR